MVEAYPNRIINIHPSLIPSFCGTGYYGLKVHEAALARGVKVTGRNGALCGCGHRYRTDHPAEGCGGKGRTIRRRMLQRRVMEEAEWVIHAEGNRPDRKWQGDS